MNVIESEQVATQQTVGGGATVTEVQVQVDAVEVEADGEKEQVKVKAKRVRLAVERAAEPLADPTLLALGHLTAAFDESERDGASRPDAERERDEAVDRLRRKRQRERELEEDRRVIDDVDRATRTEKKGKRGNDKEPREKRPPSAAALARAEKEQRSARFAELQAAPVAERDRQRQRGHKRAVDPAGRLRGILGKVKEREKARVSTRTVRERERERAAAVAAGGAASSDDERESDAEQAADAAAAGGKDVGGDDINSSNNNNNNNNDDDDSDDSLDPRALRGIRRPPPSAAAARTSSVLESDEEEDEAEDAERERDASHGSRSARDEADDDLDHAAGESSRIRAFLATGGATSARRASAASTLSASLELTPTRRVKVHNAIVTRSVQTLSMALSSPQRRARRLLNSSQHLFVAEHPTALLKSDKEKPCPPPRAGSTSEILGKADAARLARLGDRFTSSSLSLSPRRGLEHMGLKRERDRRETGGTEAGSRSSSSSSSMSRKGGRSVVFTPVTSNPFA